VKKKSKEKIVITVGKRKTSIAKAVIKEGKGIVRINKMNLNAIPQKYVRMRIEEPLILIGDLAKKVDIYVNVKGGGIMSQAEAARLAIARGLVKFFNKKEIKELFLKYDRHLLVADVRRTEPQKPYRSAARRMRQTSKR